MRGRTRGPGGLGSAAYGGGTRKAERGGRAAHIRKRAGKRRMRKHAGRRQNYIHTMDNRAGAPQRACPRAANDEGERGDEGRLPAVILPHFKSAVFPGPCHRALGSRWRSAWSTRGQCGRALRGRCGTAGRSSRRAGRGGCSPSTGSRSTAAPWRWSGQATSCL